MLQCPSDWPLRIRCPCASVSILYNTHSLSLDQSFNASASPPRCFVVVTKNSGSGDGRRQTKDSVSRAVLLYAAHALLSGPQSNVSCDNRHLSISSSMVLIWSQHFQNTAENVCCL